MKLFRFTIQERRPVRVQDGPMEEKFSHWETIFSPKNILAPNIELAKAHVERQAAYDPEFKVVTVSEDEVHAIIQVDHGMGPTLR